VGDERLGAIDVLHVGSDAGQGDMGALQGQLDRSGQGLGTGNLRRNEEDHQNTQYEWLEWHHEALFSAAMILEAVAV
jgi:hypothetical protein